MSQQSDKNWLELLSRNEKLAIEVGRLRTDVRSLKQKISALLAWKLIEQRKSLSPTLKIDAYTQYDENIFTVESYRTPKANKRSEPESFQFMANTDRDNTPQPNGNQTPVSTQLLTPTKISPSQMRIKEMLSTRIKEDLEDSTTSKLLRTPRSVRKPVTYKEPSLRVKVRKGFQFFTFSEEKVDAQE